MNPIIGLIVLIVSIAFLAFINGMEIAVVAANRIRVHHLAEAGSNAAQALERLHGNQERFFAAIVLVQTLCVVLASSMGALIGDDLLGAVGVGAAAVIVTAGTAVFGDLTPKVLGARASERVALTVAIPLDALTRILAPVAAVLAWLPRVLARAFGLNLQAGPSVTEAELRMMIGMSAESGTVAEEEADLLDRVFHFGDRRVHEVMVPRTEVVWLPRASTVQEFYAVFADSPHTRFPVFEGSPDNVVGIVGIKDVLLAISKGDLGEESPVEAVMRPAYFVPETKPVGELFREMQAGRTQMAIAVDEHGGTAGVVTLEQLLEEMVGTVRDEVGPLEEEIKEISADVVQVDGSLSVTEARAELGIDIPDGPYDTVAGFVLSELGHIPHEGESVAVDGRRITVMEMKGPKVEVLRVTRA